MTYKQPNIRYAAWSHLEFIGKFGPCSSKRQGNGALAADAPSLSTTVPEMNPV